MLALFNLIYLIASYLFCNRFIVSLMFSKCTLTITRTYFQHKTFRPSRYIEIFPDNVLEQMFCIGCVVCGPTQTDDTRTPSEPGQRF